MPLQYRTLDWQGLHNQFKLKSKLNEKIKYLYYQMALYFVNKYEIHLKQFIYEIHNFCPKYRSVITTIDIQVHL